jgi:type II secretory pathway component PulM
MMAQLAAWWRARTARERSLMQIAVLLLCGVLAPAWAYSSAATFRAEAAARLASARAVSADVGALSQAMRAQQATPIAVDGSVRERILGTANEIGLEIARLEPAGADRFRVVLEPTDSLAVYRWIEALGRSGALVSRTALARVDDTNLITGEVEVAEAP